jgi:hypothetical protein
MSIQRDRENFNFRQMTGRQLATRRVQIATAGEVFDGE